MVKPWRAGESDQHLPNPMEGHGSVRWLALYPETVQAARSDHQRTKAAANECRVVHISGAKLGAACFRAGVVGAVSGVREPCHGQ